ncbi:hypothetical protein CTI12_AA193230 [Artemisia annua]|uniref:Proton-dependent oligopeptide transporter family n=1 Tax=Artemisia annua TaxID=35608 RepID=A0A2U1P4Z8_ARTAN|nr:hypothetical protein CTI12_AA193230 [Artemisia annua]
MKMETATMEKQNSENTPTPKKKGGWRSIRYIIGNESFEKLASMSLVMNMTIYLRSNYNLSGIFLVNVVTIWMGTSNISSLAGAFISDAYIGRFYTLLAGSIVSLLGMGMMTLTAGIQHFKPPKCTNQPNCIQPENWQLGLLFTGLGLLALGARGLRPCGIAFGADQFDTNTPKGKKQLESFFNLWYLSFTLALIVALTRVVYIQTNISWVIGMIVDPSQVKSNGQARNKWRLCSIQQVENLKSVIGILPIWISGVGCMLVIDQKSTFGVLQAIQMTRTIGPRLRPKFTIPPGWMTEIAMITLSILIFIYEGIYVPKLTGIIEKKRRDSALSNDTYVAPLHVYLLIPQFALSGLAEAFACVTMMDFFTTRMPESMRTVASAVFFTSLSISSYLSSFLVNIIHKLSRTDRGMSWLGGHDVNKNRLDYYYYIITAPTKVVGAIDLQLVEVDAHDGESMSGRHHEV